MRSVGAPTPSEARSFWIKRDGARQAPRWADVVDDVGDEASEEQPEVTQTPQEAELSRLRQHVADLSARVLSLEAQMPAASKRPAAPAGSADRPDQDHGGEPGSASSQAAQGEVYGDVAAQSATDTPLDDSAGTLPQDGYHAEALEATGAAAARD